MRTTYALALLLLLASCHAPWYTYDRAGVDVGVSGNIGLGPAGAAFTEEVSAPDHGPPFPWQAYYLSGSGHGQAALQYGLSDRLGMFIETHGGLPFVSTGYGGDDVEALLESRGLSIQSGAKLRVGEHGALRLSVGTPTAVELRYLHDFSEGGTASIGVNPFGLGFGIGVSRSLSSRVGGFAAFNAGYTVISPTIVASGNRNMTASLMLGIEARARPKSATSTVGQ